MQKILLLFTILVLTDGCIDRISFDVGDLDDGIFIVDGLITDAPGPYTVKIARSSNVDDDLQFGQPILAESVVISDDLGNSETLSMLDQGIYQTSATGIRGEIGRSYKLTVHLYDGSIYESEPDELRPGGEIDSLYYQFETYTDLDGNIRHGFRVYIDSQSLEGENNYARWKFTGTYRVETNPEQHTVVVSPGVRRPDPRPCSGVIYYRRQYLATVGPCECCICWVSQTESKPNVSDNTLVSEGKFKKIEMGYVPVNEFTFFDKYRITVEQLSLGQKVYEYWKTIKDQKEGLTSLFQPSFGKLRTNIKQVNGEGQVQGLFYASSVQKREIFLTADDVPFSIQPPSVVIPESCLTAFPVATTTKPDNW